MKVNAKQKQQLIIGGVIAAAAVGYYLYSKQQQPGASLPGAFQLPAGLTRAIMIQNFDSKTSTWLEPYKSGLHNGLIQMADKDLYDLWTLLYLGHFQNKTVPAEDPRWLVWNAARAKYTNFWPA